MAGWSVKDRLRFVEARLGFTKSGLDPIEGVLFRSFRYVEGRFRYGGGGFGDGGGGFGDAPQLGAWTGFCEEFRILVTF